MADHDEDQDELPEPPQRFFTLTEAERTRRELEPFLIEAIGARKKLATLDVDDVDALTKAGAEIRGWVIDTPLIPEFDAAVRAAYAKLCKDAGAENIAVAVRSSATAEDLPANDVSNFSDLPAQAGHKIPENRGVANVGLTRLNHAHAAADLVQG